MIGHPIFMPKKLILVKILNKNPTTGYKIIVIPVFIAKEIWLISILKKKFNI